MTPSQYEQRCREMLQRNAHNMTTDEIEAFAYGSGDAALGMMGERVRMSEAEVQSLADELDDEQLRAGGLEDDIEELRERVKELEAEKSDA